VNFLYFSNFSFQMAYNWPVSAPQLRWGTLHSHAVAPAQFVGPENAAHFLIRAAKPSPTAGTLSIARIPSRSWYIIITLHHD
jgi:hypothetical protein